MEPPLYPGRFGGASGAGIGFAGSSDASVMGTNDDATVSKASCTKMGYVKDDFVKYFIKRYTKRAPVINRGYYARWAAVRKLLHQFLAAAPSDNSNAPVKKQILSLGAGFDTTYFQLQAEGTAPAVYYEVDFLEVTSRKMAAIAHHPELCGILPKDAQVQKDKGEVRSSNYNLIAADLRNISGLEQALKGAGFDPSVPTLVLAECVLIYLEAKDSEALIRWAGDKIKTGMFVIYEQIRPEDAFGQQMIRNLEMRGCPLLGIEATPSLEAKKQRFLNAGWQRAEALDMDAIYTHHLAKADVQRIEKLEIFDEFEEWHIMQEHYCIALGVRVLADPSFTKDATEKFRHAADTGWGLGSGQHGQPLFDQE